MNTLNSSDCENPICACEKYEENMDYKLCLAELDYEYHNCTKNCASDVTCISECSREYND